VSSIARAVVVLVVLVTIIIAVVIAVGAAVILTAVIVAIGVDETVAPGDAVEVIASSTVASAGMWDVNETQASRIVLFIQEKSVLNHEIL